MTYMIYYLTCKDQHEARLIAGSLVKNRLAACAKMTNVESIFHWDNAIQKNTEVLLIIESTAEKFDEINSLIAKHHSYEEYVLSGMKVEKTTPGVLKWIESSVVNGN